MMASPEVRRAASPSKQAGFLFKGTGVEEFERIAQRPASPSRGRPISGTPSRPTSALNQYHQGPIQAGFEQYPDYSKINKERGNHNKDDTFNTPSGLNDKNFNAMVRVSKRDLYDICEQSFRKSVGSLTMDILQELRQQMHESFDVIRKDTAVAAEARATGEATMAVVLSQIHETLHERNGDLNTVQKEIRNGEMLVLEGNRDMMLRLEGKLMQNLDQVRNEVQDVRRAQEEAEGAMMAQMREFAAKQAKADESGVGQRTEEQIALVATMQTSLNAYVVQNNKEILNVQDEQAKQRDLICSAVEEQMTKQLSGGISVDNTQVLSFIKRLNVSSSNDFSQLLSEIGKIQKALNVDFAQLCEKVTEIGEMEHMLEDQVMENTKSLRLGDQFGHRSSMEHDDGRRHHGPQRHAHRGVTGTRMREFWAQTESTNAVDAGTMTDPVFQKSKKKAFKKKFDPADTFLDKKTVVQLAAEKAKDTKPVFADAEAMRAKVRQALIKPQYDVRAFYTSSGCWQAIARSSYFESLTFFMILSNAIWIAVDIDFNESDILYKAHPVFIVAENVFCAYFSSEVVIRFLAFKRKSHCLQDFWFMFDIALVTLMVAETWILTTVVYFLDQGGNMGLRNASILRVLRLAKMVRISRMARLLRAIPELVILLKGIGAAARSVFVFFILWLIIIYIFAVVFRQLTEGDSIGRDYFRTVPVAMNTLLLDGILPDNSVFVNDLAKGNPLLWPIIIGFIFLAAVTLMYMLIGVLVDVVSVIASTEKEGMTVISLASQLRAAWEAMSRDTEEMISKTCFQQLLVHPDLVRIAGDVGVDFLMLVDMADVVFEEYEKDDRQMTFENFVELMLKMRGANPVTVKDTQDCLKATRGMVQRCLERMCAKFDEDFASIRHDIKRQSELAQRLHAEHMSSLEDGEDSDEEEVVTQTAQLRSSLRSEDEELDMMECQTMDKAFTATFRAGDE